MGYIRHHAIIVTGSYDYDGKLSEAIDFECGKWHWAAVARCKALELFGGDNVSELMHSTINNIKSFCIVPDGSKEGREVSDKGDDNRDIFIKWLESLIDGDMSSPLDWVEVQYGDGDKVTKIVRDSDEKWRDEEPDSK